MVAPADARSAALLTRQLVCPIQGSGFRVNNRKVEDEAAVISEEDLIDGRLLLLAAGKKNKLLLRCA